MISIDWSSWGNAVNRAIQSLWDRLGIEDKAIAGLRSDILELRKEVKTMSTAEDNLASAVKAAEARLDGVIPTVKSLKDTVDQLNAQIAGMTNVDPALQALADDLNSHVTAFDAALNPPAPTDTTTTPAS